MERDTGRRREPGEKVLLVLIENEDGDTRGRDPMGHKSTSQILTIPRLVGLKRSAAVDENERHQWVGQMIVLDEHLTHLRRLVAVVSLPPTTDGVEDDWSFLRQRGFRHESEHIKWR
ncbi:unnamed protein product [Nippostrongylus brasiliensis]|uniref:Transposase n=1 Tax=Nippostrongylus brasiliensis TaxID=27835 RepID=A0A0N4Y4S7_NIPBR|nr:unnamed protein product [Nippostrongylus brasiliensis]